MPVNTVGLAPGVYIDEFEPGQPIAGVGTSTAAFIGDATQGPVDEPTKITSWDEFRQNFGDAPADGSYLWYAVRAFFTNGGTVCYVVRATGSTAAFLTVQNRNAKNSWIVRARTFGPPAIGVAFASNNRLKAADTKVFQPKTTTAAPVGREFTLPAGQGKSFRPGDRVLIGTEELLASRVSGDKLTVTTDPDGTHVGVEVVRLADTQGKARTIRLGTTVAAPIAADVLIPGAILTLSQTIGGIITTDTRVVANVQTEYLDAATITYRVTFRDGLAGIYSLDGAKPITVVSEEFDLTVTKGATPTKYERLSLDAAHRRYFIDAVNDDIVGAVTIRWVDPRPADPLPARLPANLAATPLAGGAAGPIGQANFVRAIATLERVDDVNLLACPDAVALTAVADVNNVQAEMISHCERLGDRFAILDSRPALPLFGAGSVDAQRNALDSAQGYAALYYPWLQVSPAAPGEELFVPPSGHICGVIARSDAHRGVFKAPANEIIAGAIGVQQLMSDTEQGQLNERGINCVRVFGDGGRPMLWGARTTATNTNWRYVSTRRLFLYLEESIQEGIRWGIFEPNNQALWKKLKRSITDFLMRAYRDGALFGAKPEEAFYVRIDEALNPFSEQQLGRLTIEIGVRPAFPAEFIIVRIGIWAGGTETTET